MATRLLAETILEKINRAEQNRRRAKRMLDEMRLAYENADKALQGFLTEAALHGLMFDYSPVTGKRELNPPTFGYDDERGGKVVDLAEGRK